MQKFELAVIRKRMVRKVHGFAAYCLAKRICCRSNVYIVIVALVIEKENISFIAYSIKISYQSLYQPVKAGVKFAFDKLYAAIL